MATAEEDYKKLTVLTHERLELLKKRLGDRHPEVAQALSDVALSQMFAGDFAGAERTYLEVIEMDIALLGPDHPEVASARENLGNVYYRSGQLDKTAKNLEVVLAMRRKALGDDSEPVARTLANMATVYKKAGNDEAAERTYREAIERLTKKLGPEHPDVGMTLLGFGDLLRKTGELPRSRNRAQALAGHPRQGVRGKQRHGPEDDQAARRPLHRLEEARAGGGVHGEAEARASRPALKRILLYGAVGGVLRRSTLAAIWKRLLLTALLAAAPLAAAEPTRLVIESQPGLRPSANRLVDGPHPWVASVMELVGLDAAGPDIRVVLVPESSPLARGVPAWVTGYTDGVSNVVVLLAERTPSYPDGGLEEVLAHEVAHVLIHRASGGRRVPRWFNEGLAMLAARSWRLRDQTELALGLLSGPRVPLWKLDDMFQGDRWQVEHGYALSGTLVRDLLDRYGPAVPRLVLARLAHGDTFEEAMRRATGATVLDIGEAFYERQASLKRWIPILTSTAVLWFGISLLAILAGIRKRRRRVELEEEAAEGDAEAEQPPDVTVN